MSYILTSIVTDSNGNVYVGARTTQNKGNIYKSDGTNGFTILPTTINEGIKSLATNINDILFFATNTKIYKQNGTQFQQILGITGRITKIIINQTTGTVYDGTNQSSNSVIIYKSDGTNDFQKLFENPNTTYLISIICDDASNTIYFSLSSLRLGNDKLDFLQLMKNNM